MPIQNPLKTVGITSFYRIIAVLQISSPATRAYRQTLCAWRRFFDGDPGELKLSATHGTWNKLAFSFYIIFSYLDGAEVESQANKQNNWSEIKFKQNISILNVYICFRAKIEHPVWPYATTETKSKLTWLKRLNYVDLKLIKAKLS